MKKVREAVGKGKKADKKELLSEAIKGMLTKSKVKSLKVKFK